MRIEIYVVGTFAAIHRWKDAPDVVAFLKHPHRHLFHWKVSFLVDHADRQKEFFILKDRIEQTITAQLKSKEVEWWSCESWAAFLLHHIEGAIRVEVSEDAENGAVVSV